MSTPDPLCQAILEELARQDAQAKAVAELLAEAEETFGPAELAPVEPTTSRTVPPAQAASKSAAPTKPRPSWAALQKLFAKWPDRLVTYPVWVVVAAATHLAVAALFAAGILFATALLYLLAGFADRLIGVPVVRFAAVGVGLLAGLGSFHPVWKSFCNALRNCPW